MILFVSSRPLERAENIKAVWNAYQGEKEFANLEFPYTDIKCEHGLKSGAYDLMVTDELVSCSPGKYLFIGHGMGAGKTYGLQQPNRYFQAPHLITRAIASSPAMVPFVAKYCGIDEDKVIAIGMPRTDIYFTAEHKKTGKHLYAPTYRFYDWLPKWSIISENLRPGHTIMAKPHMLQSRFEPTRWGNIEMLSPDDRSTPYLMEMDTLITDYSSIMFDAMVMRKPVILFAKDKDIYLSMRGMYLPYPSKYSRIFLSNEQELALAIPKVEWEDRDEEYRDYFVSSCDGHSVERILQIIEDLSK